MKNNHGITLTSLMIYVIGMIVVVATIATLTTYFYKNIDTTAINDTTTTQYTKFTSIFSEEINKEGNTVIDCKNTEEDNKKTSYIIFSSGNQYTYLSENNSIYKNQVKICDNIEDADFSYSYQDSKYTITVNFKNEKFNKTGNNALKYTIKNSKY